MLSCMLHACYVYAMHTITRYFAYMMYTMACTMTMTLEVQLGPDQKCASPPLKMRSTNACQPPSKCAENACAFQQQIMF